MWKLFIGAMTGVVIGLSIMNHREEINDTRYQVTCLKKSDRN